MKKSDEVVRIGLDGRMQASLDWSEARQKALSHREQNCRLLWEIDLGLFDRLYRPLTDQTQFLSLSLSLEHFQNTLWKEFQAESKGLSIYQGSADFSVNFPWNEEQINNWHDWLQDSFGTISEMNKETGLCARSFGDVDPTSLRDSHGHHLVSLFCRDVGGEYLDLLVSRLPDGLDCYLLMDDSSIASPLWRAQLMTKERYPRLQLGLEQKNLDAIKMGVCLPSMALHRASDYDNLDEVLSVLEGASYSFRIIPESLLTAEWDGLDSLLVVSRSISAQGKRKLLGFCAAGGVVVTLGAALELPQECSFEEWRHLQKMS